MSGPLPHGREADTGIDRSRSSDAVEDGRAETASQKADRNWNDLLQEVRVTQTCTQILAGFLFAAAFQQRFTDLDRYQLGLYLALVALAGLATAVALAVVMMHRRYFGTFRKSHVVRAGNLLLQIDLALVCLLTAGSASLVFDVALGRAAGLAVMMGLLAVSGVLWAFGPLLTRAGSTPADREEDDRTPRRRS